ncbi:zinc carboxypeptidase [Pseudoflavitalea sp. X16]|uniref:M14-type cytosolic carboxypeptidase n=1 Tax=Paraflavitalea devenefica TaxID=2716334 RepID=UPI001421438D|nr:M14-type cytosolic carboxypeptidase [Paraflavitalea devenefica]NII28822.1 zinc carboxypeptidase [Paraflavitalea devenefica]
MKIVSLLILAFLACKNPRCQELRVTTSFESGSARVLGIDNATQTIRIIPAGDPKRGMPNWWNLRIDSINSNKPVFLEVLSSGELVQGGPSGNLRKLPPDWTWPDRAAYSTDGKIWKHTPAGIREGNYMRYRIEPGSSTLWIAWGPPFTPTDAAAFIQHLTQKHPFMKAFTLAQSREGRNVPALKISEGSKPDLQRPAIWVQARQHAWEVGGSWVAVGLAEWLAGEDKEAVWLRRYADIYIIPLMDVDHVATGDGGKHALPHDHNRDWAPTPHWPEVAASQQYIRRLAEEGRMNIFLDLHNPAPGNKVQTMYVLDKTYMGKEAFPRQERFIELLKEEFGKIKQHRNGPKPSVATPEELVSEAWVLENANPNTIGFCIETPWNAPKSTTAGYRAVGESLGRVMGKLLYTL